MLSKWDRRFLELARAVAAWSRDPSTKCGCAIVDERKKIVSVGFNGFAQGCDDDPALYADRARKLKRVVHAEANAIITAARPLYGCTAYTVPFPTCSQCAAWLIQAGIVRVVAPEPTPELRERWGEDLAEAAQMFREAGVEFVTVPQGEL